jgi:hypothetical protein
MSVLPGAGRHGIFLLCLNCQRRYKPGFRSEAGSMLNERMDRFGF